LGRRKAASFLIPALDRHSINKRARLCLQGLFASNAFLLRGPRNPLSQPLGCAAAESFPRLGQAERYYVLATSPLRNFAHGIFLQSNDHT